MQSFIKALLTRSSVVMLTLGISAGVTAGCDSESDLSVRAAELEAAQEGAESFHEKNDECVQAFHECLDQGGDGPSCHGQSEGCERPDIDMDQGMCKGEGHRPPPQDGEGDDRPPPPQDGEDGDGQPPPPPQASEGGEPNQDGEDGQRPPPKDGESDKDGEGKKGPGCRPPLAHEEIRVCHDEAKACVDGGGDPQACGETVHACVKDAVSAAFEALCSENLASCEGNDEDPHCAHMAQICEEGVPMPPHPAPKPGND
ncbi:MAG: hypothetical protein ACPG4T_03050 [Nannocystaceae bacterium]